MSRKSDYTLILVTDKVVVRADFSGTGFRLMQEPQVQEATANASLLESVRRVIGQGAPATRRLAILSTSVWNQIVSLPRLGIDGVDASQLSEALKYEVEPLVGIDPDSARLGFVELDPVPEHRRFWVNVAQVSDWEAIRDFVGSRKVREVVLAHPVAGSDSGGKSRIEFWDSSVLQTDEQGRLRQVNHSPATATRWATDFGFDSIETALQSGKILLAPENGRSDLPEYDPERMDLNDPAQLADWMTVAAKRLNAVDNLPSIRRVRKSSGSNKSWLVRAAALIAVTGFCGWHLHWLNTGKNDLRIQIIELEKPGVEKQKYDSMLGDVMQAREESVASSVETKAELQKVRFFFENQTDRLHTLMKKLVELRTSDLVIRKIDVTDRGTTVSGFSLDSEAAPLLTNRLRDAVSDAGWKIHPPSQQGLLKMTNGGPWDFSILLEDVGPPVPIPASRENVATRGISGRTR